MADKFNAAPSPLPIVNLSEEASAMPASIFRLPLPVMAETVWLLYLISSDPDSCILRVPLLKSRVPLIFPLSVSLISPSIFVVPFPAIVLSRTPDARSVELLVILPVRFSKADVNAPLEIVTS